MISKEMQLILKRQLISEEGLRLMPYKDTVGKITIGVGRNLEDKGISNDEAMELLDNDISYFDMELTNRFPFYSLMSDIRKSVLINMAFNIGIMSIYGFTNMLNNLKLGKYDLAAQDMLDSKWAKQVGSRAITLSNIMKTDNLNN